MDLVTPEPTKVPVIFLDCHFKGGHVYSTVLRPDLGDTEERAGQFTVLTFPRNQETIEILDSDVALRSRRLGTVVIEEPKKKAPSNV